MKDIMNDKTEPKKSYLDELDELEQQANGAFSMPAEQYQKLQEQRDADKIKRAVKRAIK